MRENYITVKGYGTNELVIQKSRFLTSIRRAETEEDALIFINEVKKSHHTATHNCSAYLIGEHDGIQKANDDGEPSGTAGFPMLEVLKKQGLKDVVVVVTRYYGGIKLGSGGLIRAYGRATTEGITVAGTVERNLHSLMKVTVDYTWLGKIENEVRQSKYPLKDILYANDVDLLIYVPVLEEDAFTQWMMDLTNGQMQILSIEHEFLEFSL